MKQVIFIVLAQLVAVSAFAQTVAFFSEDLKYTLRYSCKPTIENVATLNVPEGLEHVVVDDLGIRATYRGQGINIAKRDNQQITQVSASSTNPTVARRNVCKNEFTLSIEGVDVKFHRYKLEQATLERGNIDTKKLILLDPRARTLLVVWETGYCEDPGSGGNIMLFNPEDIFYVQDIVYAMTAEERIKNKAKIFDLLKVDLNEGDLAYINVYELDLPVANLEYPIDLQKPRVNIDESEAAILQKIGSTRPLAKDLFIPITDGIECN
jgi:hypothetical protein